jgi:hypothetical protein
MLRIRAEHGRELEGAAERDQDAREEFAKSVRLHRQRLMEMYETYLPDCIEAMVQ